MPFHREKGWYRADRNLDTIRAARWHRPGYRHELVETRSEFGTVGSLRREIADQWRIVLANLGVTRHQKVDDDIDRRAAIFDGNLANELEASQLVALVITVSVQGFDEGGVFAVT